MSSMVVFKAHSITEDDESGCWKPERLWALGREVARDLGWRRRGDGLFVVFISDLRRAVETVELAFGSTE